MIELRHHTFSAVNINSGTEDDRLLDSVAFSSTEGLLLKIEVLLGKIDVSGGMLNGGNYTITIKKTDSDAEQAEYVPTTVSSVAAMLRLTFDVPVNNGESLNIYAYSDNAMDVAISGTLFYWNANQIVLTPDTQTEIDTISTNADLNQPVSALGPVTIKKAIEAMLSAMAGNSTFYSGQVQFKGVDGNTTIVSVEVDEDGQRSNAIIT